MSRVRYTAICLVCKTEAPMPDMHTLPQGWDQTMSGDTLCPKCVKDIRDALDAIKRKRTNAKI